MKAEQKQLITEIMNEDAKDGLYKQTAVEWLIEKLEAAKMLDPYYKETLRIPNLIEQAKQMEKQQIIKAWDNGHNDGWNTRENDYNPNYHKKGTGQEWYDYEFNYKYGQLKQK